MCQPKWYSLDEKPELKAAIMIECGAKAGKIGASSHLQRKIHLPLEATRTTLL